ncbi:hypothetical protein A3K82_01760 [Candidatus Pacearchaeota archaeon RBG_19FT_COMBO_34_9]|nr:MAG: hypothetical protein A3K82_01760 [Candidatus Pacearchaeota archaeon RBG_19FT_COMBO_34_9]OGJ16707.1 MAG: hypothetical protein A3K74_00635 [Candidatus Pacearchaeota archaeon RBG_13_33_26]
MIDKFNTAVCAGALSAFLAFNPIQAYSQETKQKCEIDLNLGEGLEEKLKEPRFNEFSIGNLNFQIFTPKISAEIPLPGKTKLFTELYYNSENGVGTHAKIEFKNLEFNLGGYYSIGSYGFNSGFGLVFDRFKFGIGYKRDGINNSIFLNGTLKL